jgi:hypothetical protein
MASVEKPIENAILEYLKQIGIFAWKNQSTGMWDPTKKLYRKSWNKNHINGVSDILGILPDGRFLAIEVKTPKPNKTYPSKNQREFIERITHSGGMAIVARCVGDVSDALDTYGVKTCVTILPT